MIRVFWIPSRDGQYMDLEAKELQSIETNKAYARAEKFYEDKEYVSNMLDGRGYIEIPAVGGKFRYIQAD